MKTLKTSALDSLWSALRERGYTLVGPTVRDQAIVYDELESPRDLPIGWTDVQDGGTYRLEKRDDNAFFGYTLGPQSWKRFLFPPELRLWRAERDGQGFHVHTDEPAQDTRYAFVGVRACELAAIAVKDRVFLAGEHVDPVYRRRRETAFLVAVQCGQAGGTCFCASMGTGPGISGGYDLALTEVIDKKKHILLAESGSERGAEILAELGGTESTDGERAAGERAVARAEAEMGRRLETEGLPELLAKNREHPRWDEVAERCLACANCTMVCPTCFCHTVEDTTDLTGEHAERWRRWDSCFTADFSYLHGGSVRPSTRSRYRQWMSHKLSTWVDQFETFGCVGCGRCITWCPVGIDLTEEARAIRSGDPAPDPDERAATSRTSS